MLCLRKILVAKTYMDKRGEYQDFPSKRFFSECRKFSQGNPSVFQNVSGNEKVYAQQGNITIFIGNFVSQVPKNFLGEPICVLQYF